ncbi:MAG: 5'-deoxyadenosine deaminase [bacterium]
MSSILVKGGTIVTMDRDRRILKGDLLIEGNSIAGVGTFRKWASTEIDAADKVVLPGFVQTHVHLCQTLFRGAADDLELLDWLRFRIWPLEGAHDEESVYWSAQLGIAELIRGGTTTVADMGTARHTESIARALEESGIRAVFGKAMMDSDDDVPPTLLEKTEDSLALSLELLKKWHGRGNGRLQYAFAPRFVLSCTEELLKEVGELAKKYGVGIHSHASENRKEAELMERKRGARNILYFDELGLTGPSLRLAHCIWLNPQEMDVLARTGTKVLHCPSANLKLASGAAKVPEMIARGIDVSLGADGAACNNNLDMFVEMRLCALIQKPTYGPTSMRAGTVLEMATLGGAKALGLEGAIGSIEEGKRADVIVIDLNSLHNQPSWGSDVISRLVYSARAGDVETVIVDGNILMRDRVLTHIDEERLIQECNTSIRRVRERCGL